MFEYDDKEGRWNAAHHPFTSPYEADMDKLESTGAVVRWPMTWCSMYRAWSGSIRIHRQTSRRSSSAH